MNGSNFDYSLNLTGSLSTDKLGITTTVKEQVEHIEVTPPHPDRTRHFQNCRRPTTQSTKLTTTTTQKTRW